MSDTKDPTRKPPLAGVRVLDFSRVIAGPLCTQHMADLGAEVVKVENPVTGDEVRGFNRDGTPGRSFFFNTFNRSKRSVALDLKRPEGQEIAHALAGRADVLVENFRPGVMARFNLDAERLCADYPTLIYLSVSAYGASGSMSDRPGFDPVLQAESGMMALTGRPEDPPMRHPLSIIDTMTANHALAAVLAALLARERSGHGERIDLALMDTAIGALNNAAGEYFATGQIPKRSGNSHMRATPTDMFRTATDPIYMAVSSNRLFGQLCRDVLDRPDLPDDPRFKTPNNRFANRPELKALIEDILMREPVEHWLERMRHLPAGAVRTLDVAVESTEARERNMVQTIDDPEGPIRVMGSPFKFQNSPLSPPAPPPHHGAHTRAVLSEWLDFGAAEIDALAEQGIVAQPADG